MDEGPTSFVPYFIVYTIHARLGIRTVCKIGYKIICKLTYLGYTRLKTFDKF